MDLYVYFAQHRLMDEQTTAGRKLKALREKAGISHQEMANALGITKSTYSSKEDKSKRPVFDPDFVREVAKILEGSGIQPHETWRELVGVVPAAIADFKPSSERPKPNGTTPISELDVRAQGGAGFNHEPNGPEPVVAEWRMSTVMLRGQTTAVPEQIKIITVYGDSMVPDFLPGERVLVDLSDQIPSPPGVFVVWDGFGLVIKRLEMVPYSDPPMVKLKSANEAYDAYERPLSDVVVNGRVIGKWKWT